MKHPIKVTIYLDVDTSHADYHGSLDIDDIVAKANADFSPLMDGQCEDGTQITNVVVEAVE